MLKQREFLRISGATPKNFHGSVRAPPSKSYLHRALFIASLCEGESEVQCKGFELSEDTKATMRVLKGFGTRVVLNVNEGLIRIIPGLLSAPRNPIFVGGSGTTARFAISLAALATSGKTTITGDRSLSKRPMQPLLDALTLLGAGCRSEAANGRLPVIIEGCGLKGGKSFVDGSISSQFISSLLIACTRAEKDSYIQVTNPSNLVSEPYIDATLAVLKHFGFYVRSNSSNTRFLVKGNQRVKAGTFMIPGDMSSAASLIAVAIASRGRVRIDGINTRFPQSDYAFLKIARMFGAIMVRSKDSISVEAGKRYPARRTIRLNLKHSPDLMPIVACLAAATGAKRVEITNVGHLRFKESDRLATVSRELRKLGVSTRELQTSITVHPPRPAKTASSERKPILLDSESDHRIMMALTVAGISGRFGEVAISDPSCVRKSYPNFIADVQRLSQETDLLKIIRS